MKLLYFSFFIIQIALCFFIKVIKSKQINFVINKKKYDIIYEYKTVTFSDIDLLGVMYHSNHIKYTGDFIIKHAMDAFDKKHFYFYIKNINITYEIPLKIGDEYTLIGAITEYKNTSLKLNIIVLKNSDIENPNNLNNISMLLKNSVLGLEPHPNTYENVNEVIDDHQKNGFSIHLSDDDLKNLGEQNICSSYFYATYTLVKINKYGIKQNITGGLKSKFKYIKFEDFKKLSNAFCS